MSNTKRAMAMAIAEIRALRMENQILRAKVDTMELLGAFLHADPPRRGGGLMSEDAAQLLQRELDNMPDAKVSA